MLNTIRKWRRALGWSQFKLEQESGVSRNKIALFEQGYRTLTNEDYEKLSKALSKEDAIRNAKGINEERQEL